MYLAQKRLQISKMESFGSIFKGFLALTVDAKLSILGILTAPRNSLRFIDDLVGRARVSHGECLFCMHHLGQSIQE